MSSVSSTTQPELSASLRPDQWLEHVLRSAAQRIPEPVVGFLLGRGLQEQAIAELEMGVWSAAPVPAPMEDFRARYGATGNQLRGWLVYPLRDGRGGLLGFEARNLQKKEVTQYKLPRAFWNPVFIGLHRAMPKLWDGSDVWIGEGLFDMGALEHIVPEQDAVMAALTAKINQSHIKFLSRFVRGTVHLVFDRDEKGRKAAIGYIDEETGKEKWGAIKSMVRVGIRCRDVSYRCPPGCKDPGDIWERGGDVGLRMAFRHSI